MTDDRRLIEDYLPIQAISAEASREKSVRKGHISTLHLWWARRPLVACRAAVYGALVPASQFVPINGSDQQKKSLGRANAAKFIERLCQYPGSPDVIKEAQEHILKAHAERLTKELQVVGRASGLPVDGASGSNPSSPQRGSEPSGGRPNPQTPLPAWVVEFNWPADKTVVTVDDIVAGRAPRPKVLDMFAGGGAIPLEALRLGCEAYALDLNPVAHIIQLCTLVYPQKFGKPDPNVKGSAKDGTWAGLAAEVEHWGKWVLEKVKAEIGDLYPPIPDPEFQPRIGANGRESFEEPQQEMAFAQDEQLHLGENLQSSIRNPQLKGFLTPVAYLWTRTVRCKNPACGATVPLVKQTWLCKKKDRFVAMSVVAPKGEKRVRFDIVEAPTEDRLGFDPEAFSKAGNATCPFCGTVADSDYVKAEGCAHRLGNQMMAVVFTRPKRTGKVYISADSLDNYIPNDGEINKRTDALCSKWGFTRPTEPIVTDAKNCCWSLLYGLTKFQDLFLPRQLLCLLSFATGLRAAEEEVKHYDRERWQAIATCLACWIDRLADFESSMCTLKPGGERGVVHSFTRPAIPMVWDCAEANPFGTDSANAAGLFEYLISAIQVAEVSDRPATVQRGSATAIPITDSSLDAVISDPPYYDNVPYADVSDFFYVWLKRSVGHYYPEHFATEGTPKKSEAVADASRHGGSKEKAKRAYEDMMAQAFAESHRVLKPSGQMTVVYAHKTMLGWATLVEALRRAGFTVTEAWPLDTEMKARLRGMDSAALATSIFLIARKRDSARVGSYEEEVRSELEQIVRERVETLWRMGITGADLIIAAVGAGLRAFTRFAHVEYANGEEVPAEKFLGEVESVVLETLLEKIFGLAGSSFSAVDGPSRFYVLWRYAYRTAELDAGEAIVFTYGQPVELDGADGLATGTLALVEKKKGKYRLRDFTERGPLERLGLPDLPAARGTAQAGDVARPAPLIDVLHRALWLMENQPRKLPAFLDEARPDRERLRLVAQALAGAGLSGGSEEQTTLVNTTASEQTALGKLLANWRALVPETLFAR